MAIKTKTRHVGSLRETRVRKWMQVGRLDLSISRMCKQSNQLMSFMSFLVVNVTICLSAIGTIVKMRSDQSATAFLGPVA